MPREPMVLADTSAWVEFDRATGSPVHHRLRRLLLDSPDALAVTEPVIMEVTSGARSDQREADLRRLLARCGFLGFDPVIDFDGATTIYRRCRSVGVTPRGMIDCMIASVALRHEADLLAQDSDLARIATVVGIPLDPATNQDP